MMPNYGPASPTASSAQYLAITKSDTVNFITGTNALCRGIYVGGTGDVVAVMADDTAVTFSAVPAGTVLPIQAKRVNSASTTATLMVALF
jgi:hypothetical protein